MKSHGPWQIVDSNDIYTDPWIRVRCDDVIRPDGQPGTYSVVDLKPGVSVLAMDRHANVYLTEEFHYAVGRVTLEVVSGGIDGDEDALQTARRELQEEIGITADSWLELGVCDPFTGSIRSPTRLYLARDLSFGDADPEGTEHIGCVKMPLAEAVEKALSGEISHAPSALVILKAARVLIE